MSYIVTYTCVPYLFCCFLFLCFVFFKVNKLYELSSFQGTCWKRQNGAGEGTGDKRTSRKGKNGEGETGAREEGERRMEEDGTWARAEEGAREDPEGVGRHPGRRRWPLRPLAPQRGEKLQRGFIFLGHVIKKESGRSWCVWNWNRWTCLSSLLDIWI